MAKKINIDHELQIIQEGRYGEDVRYAIHDALYKLNQNGGGGGGGNGAALVGPGIYYARGVEALVGNDGGLVGDRLEITIFDVLNIWDNSSNAQYGNIAEFRFYDENKQLMTLPQRTVIRSTTTDVEGYGVANVVDNDISTYWQWSHTSGAYDLSHPTDIVQFWFMFEEFKPKYISYVTADCVNWAAWSPGIIQVRYVNDIGQDIFARIIDCAGDVPHLSGHETLRYKLWGAGEDWGDDEPSEE